MFLVLPDLSLKETHNSWPRHLFRTNNHSNYFPYDTIYIMKRRGVALVVLRCARPLVNCDIKMADRANNFLRFGSRRSRWDWRFGRFKHFKKMSSTNRSSYRKQRVNNCINKSTISVTPQRIYVCVTKERISNLEHGHVATRIRRTSHGLHCDTRLHFIDYDYSLGDEGRDAY